MYRAVTEEIAVKVEPFLLSDQSDAEAGRWMCAHRVTISNGGDAAVQLLSRDCHITDANGHVEEVRGAGAVSETPRLDPGDSFQCTSGCPLSTPSGIKVGRDTMQRTVRRGGRFDVAILAFSLDLPGGPRSVN